MNSVIGLFFGSFNPIHTGHLAIARYLLEKGYCCQVWLVVSPQNPLKQNRELLEGEKRLEMVRKAVADDNRLSVCDIEFSMPSPSYTADTLQVLEKKYPDKNFVLIIGGDNLRNFHLWKDYRKILERHSLLVYPRPGVEVTEPDWKNVTLVDAPLSDVSSTEIRRKVQQGEDISAWVPLAIQDQVKEYYSK